MQEGIARWMEEKPAQRVEWIDGWLRGHDPKWGLIVRYEELLRDTPGVLHGVCEHCEVNLTAAQLRRIVQRHSFEQSTGRKPGTPDAACFNRKRFKAIAGDGLVRCGHEKSNDW